MLKSKKGLTLMSLVITVIIILILAGVGTYTGINSITSSENSKLSSELIMVQHAILEEYTKYNSISAVNPTATFVGTKLNDVNISSNYIEKLNEKYYFKYDTDENKIELKDTNIGNYYVISSEEEFNKLGISNNNDEYIVNYKTGEVINKTRLKNRSGDALYISTNN